MKMIALVLLILLAWLQYKIWLQDGGIPEVLQLEDEVVELQQDVSVLKERNASLDAEVQDLKKGLDAIEERARNEMGMIREGETYYQVIDRRDDGQDQDQDEGQMQDQVQDQVQDQEQDKDHQREQQTAEKPPTQASGSDQSPDGNEIDTRDDLQIDIGDNLIKR